MRLLWFAAVIFLAGCLTADNSYTYDAVKVTYTTWGGPVGEERYHTRYVVDNDYVSYTRRYKNGTISYSANSSISEDEYKRIGMNAVESGVFVMLDEYNGSMAEYKENAASAMIEVNIDGKMKTIKLSPFSEKYAPGNIQKIIFEVKRVTQEIQSHG